MSETFDTWGLPLDADKDREIARLEKRATELWVDAEWLFSNFIGKVRPAAVNADEEKKLNEIRARLFAK